MSVAGVVLFVAGLACGLLAYRARGRRRDRVGFAASATASPSAFRAAVDPGGIRTRAELNGAAQPGPAGPLKAEISGAECVWHGHVIIRRYRTARRDEHDEQVTEVFSGTPLAVVDATGSVLVDPTGTVPDGVRKVVDRFERADPEDKRRGTVGYRYQEWVLEPGSQVYVLGEASDTSAGLTIGKPHNGGGFVIAVRNDGDERSGYEAALTILACGALLGGVALVTAGLLG